MKVLIYGEPNTEGSAVASYIHAFRSKQWEVFTFSNDQELRFYKTLPGKILRKLNFNKILKAHRKRHINAFIFQSSEIKPDMTIIFKGLNFSNDDIISLKSFTGFIVNINHDDFFSLNPNNRSALQLQSLPYYDYIFTTRVVNVSEVAQYNRNVDLLMFAFDPMLHKPNSLNNIEKRKFESDVLFVGTYERNRAALLEQLVTRLTINLAIYGALWDDLPKNSVLRKYIRSYSGLYGDDMAKAIQCSKISLGFLRKANRDDYTQRTFEIPACKGVLLAERTLFHLQLLEEGKEALFFDPSDVWDLVKKIEFLLNNSQDREQIRINGYNRVWKDDHTYLNRVEQIILKFNSCQQKD